MIPLLILFAWLMVSKGVIKIVYNDKYWFKIDLNVELRLIPRRQYRGHVRGYDFISIGPKTRSTARQFKHRYEVDWLMFTVSYVATYRNELYSIYPSGYDFEKDPHWLEKHRALELTGYFS